LIILHQRISIINLIEYSRKAIFNKIFTTHVNNITMKKLFLYTLMLTAYCTTKANAQTYNMSNDFDGVYTNFLGSPSFAGANGVNPHPNGQLQLKDLPFQTKWGLITRPSGSGPALTYNHSNGSALQMRFYIDTTMGRILPQTVVSPYWGTQSATTYITDAGTNIVYQMVSFTLQQDIPNSTEALANINLVFTTPYDIKSSPLMTSFHGTGTLIINPGTLSPTTFSAYLNAGGLTFRSRNIVQIHNDFNTAIKGTEVKGNLAQNDKFPAGPVTFSTTPTASASNPAGESLTVSTDGSYSFSGTTPGTYTYTVPVTYISNGSPTTVYETLTVVVIDNKAANIKPIAATDYSTVNMGSNVVIPVLANDRAINAGTTLNNPTILAPPAKGTATVNANGTVTYTAPTNATPANTGLDSFKYNVCDNGTPASCSDAWAYINVELANYPRTVAANDDNNTIIQNTTATGNLITNDKDANGNPLVAVPQTNIVIPGKGTYSITSNGGYTFTPVPNFTGTVQIPYTIYNSSASTPPGIDTAKASLYITVLPFELMPDMIVANINEPIAGNVATNDNVPLGANYGTPVARTGNPSSVVPTINPSTGAYTLPSVTTPGVYIYDVPVCPSATFIGTCPTAPLVITVKDPTTLNQRPIANPDIAGMKQNRASSPTQSVTVKTLSNDAASNPLATLNPALTIVSAATQGVASVNNTNGDITYTPTAGFTGRDSLKYQVCENGNTNCATAWQYFSVYPTDATTGNPTNVNTTIASDDFVRIKANSSTPITVNLLANDTDPEGNTQSIANVTTPIAITGGSYTISNGVLSFTPSTNYVGVVNIPYVVTDNGSPNAKSTGTVYIDVFANAPDAQNDHLATTQGQAINANLASNDVDPNGLALLYNTTPVAQPLNGTVSINANGTFNYAPTANFNGVDSFKYRVCNTKYCSDAWAFISVVPALNPPSSPNRAPIVQSDEAKTFANTSVSGNVSKNDVDPDGDALSYSVTSQPTNGTIVMNTDGTFTYTPNTNFVGTDNITVSICDNGSPILCKSSILSVSVINDPSPAVNDAPFANDDIVRTATKIPVSGNVLSNDSDPNGNTLTATIVGVSPVGLLFNSNGTFVYTPPNTVIDQTIQVKYAACDGATPNKCDTATLYLVVTPQAPDAQNDHMATTQGVTLNGSVATNDIDPNGLGLTYTTTPVVNTLNGSVSISANGAISYIPSPNFVGVDSFKYQVCNTKACSDAWAYVSVIPAQNPPGAANRAPIAQNDEATTFIGVSVSGNVSRNDMDPDGDVLVYSLVSNPTNGTINLNNDGTFTFIPAANFKGTENITIKVCDNNITPLCVNTILKVTVGADFTPTTNDAPYANDDIVSTSSKTPVSGNVLSNDSDPNGNTLTASLVGTGPLGLLFNSNGTFTYTPPSNIIDQTIQVKYTACDGGTPNKCDTATLYISVTPLMPEAQNDHLGTPQGVTLTGNVALNDYDPNGLALTYNTTPVTQPTNGSVSLNANGTFTYTPAPSFVGVDSFKYRVCNSKLCSEAWAYVSVIPGLNPPNAPNRAPIAQNDEATTLVGKPVSGNVSKNDTDPDGQPLGYSIASNPTSGTLSLNSDGTFTYTPSAGFVGTDKAVINVCDNATPALCVTTTLNIVVKKDPTPGTNHAPYANDDIVNTPPLTSITGNVLSNDSDPDGDALTATVLGAPPAGLILNSNGSFTYNPPAGVIDQTIPVRYIACDANKCDTAVLYLVVVPRNPDLTPSILMPSLTVLPNATVNFIAEITEVNNGDTKAGVAVFAVYTPPGYTLTFNPNATTIIPNGPGTSYAIQNANWNLTGTALGGRMYIFKAKPGVKIQALNSARIGFSLNRLNEIQPQSTATIGVYVDPDPTNREFDANTVNNVNFKILNNY
jgi:hypothetical protein